ncbi:MAG: hypothetical protein V4541_15675 [Bacteroidota bacterium]
MSAFLLSAFKTQEEVNFPEQINWDTHFLATPDYNSPYFAITATTWHYSYAATINRNNLHIDFKFSAGVDPNRSWVKLNKLQNADTKRKLLRHEQGHVNINFLLLKDGENKIRYQPYTLKNYKRLIQQNANKISAYYSNMQDRYDTETKHGSDVEKQKKWDNWIDLELKKYLN